MEISWAAISFLTAGILLAQFEEGSCAEGYRAAVVAYKPERHYDDLPEAIRARNLNNYRMRIEEVKDKADIIVFPEYGLTTVEVILKPKQHLESYSIFVPDPATNFHCNSTINVENDLREISCLAKRTTMYVVYNVVEKAEDNNIMNYYSTDVVFDSDGKLVLRCRKKRMYNELNFNTGDLSQKCTFQAKFKRNNHTVIFDVLFDSDILFFKPEDTLRDLILTSSLKNELPLSYSLSLQAAFSARNKVNLLVSEYNDFDKFYGGSGIYFKNGTSIVTVQSGLSVIEEIPQGGNDIAVTHVNVQAPRWSRPSVNLPFQNISTLERTDTKFSYSFDEENTQCEFAVNVDGGIKPYKWVAFKKETKYLGQQEQLVVCALIRPQENNLDEKPVMNITVSAKLPKDKVKQLLPLALNSNLLPAKFEFEEKNKESLKTTTMTLSQPDNLLIFGVAITLKNASALHIIHSYLIIILPFISLLWTNRYINF